MKRSILVAGCWLLVAGSYAQTVTQKLQIAFTAFEEDSQLKHAISSLYVIDAGTGQVVFNKNSQIGLAPASTQKIITSVTAFELLGKNYRYKTEFGFNKNDRQALFIIPSGDPTFGSWRWKATVTDSILDNLMSALKDKNISNIKSMYIDTTGWDSEDIPDGWIWQDIGNYYGAGAHKLNFEENQFDIVLASGESIGDPVNIVSVGSVTGSSLGSVMRKDNFQTKLTSASKGSGDNAYVYLPSYVGEEFQVRGTIPVNEKKFTISASITDPERWFTEYIFLKANLWQGEFGGAEYKKLGNDQFDIIYIHDSPSLDSIIYWFNKRSINLYGEALIKTFAYEKNGFGSTDSGVAIVQKFWKEKGMDEDELGIVDGSGLSPLNRVTTHAQVEILKFARTKDWFPYFKTSLPEYNGMSMKSGTIRGVKGFCGYHKAKNGKEYIFSFLVNNYNGSASGLVNKMYKVLDILK